MVKNGSLEEITQKISDYNIIKRQREFKYEQNLRILESSKPKPKKNIE